MDWLSAMVMRGVLGVFGTLASPRLSILIFHRVHAQSDPLFPYEPDAARFDALMHFVARTFRVMTLGEAVVHLKQATLPPRSLVITFDDGYADNAEVALPILQRYGLPATFFVVSGFLDGGRMWNDSVIESIRACRHDNLNLEYWGLGQQTLSTVTERSRLIDTLLPRIKYQSLADRQASIVRLQQLCGVEVLPATLMMRSGQVRELHRAGMEIGGHTVNHPILTTLSSSEAEIEIAQGREQLQSIIDAPVDVFAFPNGKPGVDYDHTHVALVRQTGFSGAVSTAPGVGQTGDDLFQLPRFTPWGRAIPVWAARLLLNYGNTGFACALSEERGALARNGI